MTFQEKQKKINEANEGLAKIAIEQMETERKLVELQQKLRELNQQFAMLYWQREGLVKED
jgi:hypothetical protein